MTPTAKAPMSDIPDLVRRRMSATKGRDTSPEMAVRRLLHARGWRYRVHLCPLPDVRRSVDIAFTKLRLAVMIDGCFWHGCPDHYRPATVRAEFWRAKVEGNVARDADTDQRLRAAGWTVLRFWEHEDPAEVVRAVEAHLPVKR